MARLMRSPRALLQHPEKTLTRVGARGDWFVGRQPNGPQPVPPGPEWETITDFSAYAMAGGWTQIGPHKFKFDIPPGAQWRNVRILNLVIGERYRIAWNFTGLPGLPGLMRWIAGNTGVPAAIECPTDGRYTADFTNPADGEAGTACRWAPPDVTGITTCQLQIEKVERYIGP